MRELWRSNSIKAILVVCVCISLLSCMSDDDEDTTVLPPWGLVNVKLVDPSQMLPDISNALIQIKPKSSLPSQNITADDDGNFTVTDLVSSELFVTLADNSLTKFDVDVVGTGEIANIELALNPVFGISDASGLNLSPSADAQAGIATILEPPNLNSSEGNVVICNTIENAGICEIEISGLATPNLGLPTTVYRVYIVTKTQSQRVFIQGNNLSIDPVTGIWNGQAFFGGESFPATSGDIFDVFVVVTSQSFNQPSDGVVMFDSSVDIEGAVYISSFTPLILDVR